MFTIPTFNLVTFIWRSFNAPPGPPPDVTVMANFGMGKRVMSGTDYTNWFNPPAGGGVGIDAIFRNILFPAGTDVRGFYALTFSPDYIECPAGSGRFYRAWDVDDVAKGFANEYRLCLAIPDRSNPFPTPLP